MTTETTEVALPGAPQNDRYPYGIFTVGDRAHVKYYTDIEPATVVEVNRHGKEVKVRIDNYKLAGGRSLRSFLVALLVIV